ncbi:exodeoxyribonuclease VII large subunit, partial [Aureimonas sp. AU4]|uniref:exodeoxyribonuclease VII large subunit n=1 Tax=Aureimonas sp. AU4 TaxID=1638163 RepID=UPI000A4A746D
LQGERRQLVSLARALPGVDALLALPRRRLDEAEGALGRSLRLSLSERRRSLSEVAAGLAPGQLEAGLREKRASLRHAEARVLQGARALLAARRHRLDRLGASLRPNAVASRSAEARHRLLTLGDRLDRAQLAALERRRGTLNNAWRVADSLNPRNVLERGYAIVRGEGDMPITRPEDLAPGTRFELEFARGRRRAAVAVDGRAEPLEGGEEAVAAAAAVPVARAARPKRRQQRAEADAVQGDLF